MSSDDKLQEAEKAAKNKLWTRLNSLQKTDRDQLSALIKVYVDAVRETLDSKREKDCEEAASSAAAEAHDEGYDEGYADLIQDAGVEGQARINVLETLRRLEFDTRCPFETKAYRAIADSIEVT